MTREEIMALGEEEVEERAEAVQVELEAEDADLEALEAEVDAIEERRAAIIEERKQAAEAVLKGAGTPVEEREEDKKMTNMEIRNSAEYIEAYANYIKTDSDAECRALLTENVSGTVPVPEFVYDIVKTAWEREGIMSRVRKSYLKGNLKVGFEISGDDAVIHTEGDNAIDPENLVLGVVNLVPQSIKKTVQITDEIYDLRGSSFLRYIYDELTYRIAKKAADTLVAKILACGTVSTTTCPGVPSITTASVSMSLVAEAVANLSDEADNPVIIMNKLTYADFKKAQAAASFAADPFEGLPVIFNNSMKSLSAASTGNAFMIVGDLDHGALANFPAGEAIDFKFDDMTLKKQDLIEVLGRQYVALGVVAPNAFVKVTK